MIKISALLGLTVLLGACGYVSEYEKAVYEWEPTYCYQSIGTVACYKEPYHRDERRLVNYFGPDPSRYDKPDAPEQAPHAPPEMVNYWVKDAEPVPRPAAHGKLANLPWLDPVTAKADTERKELAWLASDPRGTRALLRQMGIGPEAVIGGYGAGVGQAGAKGTPKVITRVPARKILEAASTPPLQPAPAAQPKPPVIEVDVN